MTYPVRQLAPGTVTFTERNLAIRYDGTNSAAILASVTWPPDTGNFTPTVTSESDGILKIQVSEVVDDYSPLVVIHTGDYVVHGPIGGLLQVHDQNWMDQYAVVLATQ